MKWIFSTVVSVSLMSVAGLSYADHYFYADLGLGYAAASNMPDSEDFNQLPGTDAVGSLDRTRNNYGGRIGIGVMWDANAWLSYGLETAGAYYGVTKYSNAASSVEMNYYGIECLGVARFNMNKFHLLLKAGMTDERMHPTKSNINNADFDGNNQVLPEVGMGIAYSVTPNLLVGLSYYHTFGDDVSFTSTETAENLPSVDMGFLEFLYFM